MFARYRARELQVCCIAILHVFTLFNNMFARYCIRELQCTSAPNPRLLTRSRVAPITALVLIYEYDIRNVKFITGALDVSTIHDTEPQVGETFEQTPAIHFASRAKVSQY